MADKKVVPAPDPDAVDPTAAAKARRTDGRTFPQMVYRGEELNDPKNQAVAHNQPELDALLGAGFRVVE